MDISLIKTRPQMIVINYKGRNHGQSCHLVSIVPPSIFVHFMSQVLLLFTIAMYLHTVMNSIYLEPKGGRSTHLICKIYGSKMSCHRQCIKVYDSNHYRVGLIFSYLASFFPIANPFPYDFRGLLCVTIASYTFYPSHQATMTRFVQHQDFQCHFKEIMYDKSRIPILTSHSALNQTAIQIEKRYFIILKTLKLRSFIFRVDKATSRMEYMNGLQPLYSKPKLQEYKEWSLKESY